jgi:hypothetical protein
MRFQVTTTGLGQAVIDLTGARAAITTRWKQSAKVVGEWAVAFIKRDFRTGGTTKTRTAVRTGNLRAAYDNRVTATGAGVDLDIGLIRSGADAKVLFYGRVQEGFDAAGARVAQFVIVPKNAPYLVFPIRMGGGMARKNIVGWASVKKVVLKPRPSLDAVAATYPAILEDRLVRDVTQRVNKA